MENVIYEAKGERVIVKAEKEAVDKYDTTSEKNQRSIYGEVISVGVEVTSGVFAGEKVIMTRHGGAEIIDEEGNETGYYILDQRDILASVK